MPASLVPPSVESASASASTAPPPEDSSLPSDSNSPQLTAPYVSLISAAAFARACKLTGSTNFTLYIRPEDAKLCSTSAASPVDPSNLSAVPEVYHDFTDIFSKAKATTLAPHREYDLRIDLEEGASPPLGTVYSLSQTELGALRTFIDKHLSYGFIQQSTSAHGAPVLFVRKKDGSLRLCVDYRGLNKISKKDRYPLPLISNLLDSPSKAKIYSKIDLHHAYHLVRIAEGDEWKTVFHTRYGSFEWNVMPFSLTNAPTAFQRFVNSILSNMLDVCVVIYLDNILIYSEDIESHQKHVREVLRRLRKHNLFAKPEKCEFHTTSTEYLGFCLSPNGLSMSADKVKAISDWPEPHKVKDIQSFLGFANFYRRFIFNYSDIVVPLTWLTRKNIPWNFGEDCCSTFNLLKKAFTSAPILTHWVPDAPLTVETDASDYAITGILSITGSDEVLHPVAYYSRTLSAPELNYDTHDKELLAIFKAFKHWRHYLEGSATPVDVVTDHKNLEYFSSSKVLTCRQARWSEYLSQFNLAICFRPGRLRAKPDALTRHWDVYPKEGDRDYARVNPHNLRPMFTQEQLASSLRATILLAPAIRTAILVDVEQLHKDILAALPSDPVALSHKSDSSDSRWSMDSAGLLRLDDRIYVPDTNDLRLRVLRYKHDHPLSGHFGQNRTLELVRWEYTWPGVRTFVKDYVSSCTSCGHAKVPKHRPYGLLKQLPIPARPWHSISMDFIEQLPSSDGFTSILVIVDRLSKQGIFIPTYDTISSPELAKLFVAHVFSKHGVPTHVTSDRGSEFVSHFFRSLGKALGMTLHFTSGYHPEGDGQTEWTNQTLEQYLRIYCNYQQDNWAELLPLAEFAFNNSPSATTGVSPFFANKGYHPDIAVNSDLGLSSSHAQEYTSDLKELHEFLRSEMALAQQRYQGPADAKRSTPPDFKIGDEVYVKAKYFRSTHPSKKLSDKNFGPFKVIAKPGSLSFTLRLPDTMKSMHPVFHVSQLETSLQSSIPNHVQSPPPPIEVDGEVEYEVEEILDSKIDCRRRHCQLLYLVHWAGYASTDEETLWLLATELDHALELIEDFHHKYSGKPGPHKSA